MKTVRHLVVTVLVALTACGQTDVRSPGAAASWQLSGSSLVRPVEISDDGEHIYLAFGDDQELPAVFGVTHGGEETLVNGQMRAGSYVIDELYPALVFRLGRDVARATKAGR